jgi:hypothetical protein
VCKIDTLSKGYFGGAEQEVSDHGGRRRGIAAMSRRELVAIDVAGLCRLLVEFVTRLLVRGTKQ